MKKYLFLICVLFSNLIYADVPSHQTAEVIHLLDVIQKTSCLINRNGTSYAGHDVIKHIQKKYNYFKDDIETTEDFIKYSATKSTMSGKFYMISCSDEKEITVQKWLMNELKAYREAEALSLVQNIKCNNPRPQMCTMQYIPVCAKLNNGSAKAYPSDCSACSDTNVVSYNKSECKS